MKALVLTEGSSRIGFGHITRTLSLTQALKSFGFKVHFTVYGDETVEKVLNKEDFSYEIRNWFGKLPNVETYDVVIVDSYKAPLGIYKEIIQKDSSNLLLKFNLAKLYTKEYRKKDAIPLLEELIKADSLNPEYYYELGMIYKNKGARGFLKSGNYFLSSYKIDTTYIKSVYEHMML